MSEPKLVVVSDRIQLIFADGHWSIYQIENGRDGVIARAVNLDESEVRCLIGALEQSLGERKP